MIIYLVAFIISLFVLFLFKKENRSNGLFLLLLCSISWFEPNLDFVGLDGLTIRQIGENATFCSILLLLVFRKHNNKYTKKLDCKKLLIFVNILLLYALIISLSTVISGKESLFNVIALFKPIFAFLCIYVIRDVKKEECIEALIKLLRFTFIIGVIAFVQVLLGFNFFGSAVLEYDEGVDRFWSPYAVASFCCMCTLVMNPSKKLLFLFFLLLVILPLRRGIMISTILSIALYFIFEIKHNKMPKGVLVVALAGLLALPFLASRFSSESDNASSDFRTMMSGDIDYGSFRNGVTGGSFLFRIAILTERIDYLSNNGGELLTGVGMIHEHTAQKKFNFHLGVFTTINGERFPQQIDTLDIVWSPIIMRLGLIGIILYLFLFGYLLLFYLRNVKYSRWSILGAMYLFCAFINSVADNQLVSYSSILLYYIFFVIILEDKRKILIGTDKHFSSKTNTER